MIFEKKVLFVKCDGDGRGYVGGTETPGICDAEAPSWEFSESDGANSRAELEDDLVNHGWLTDGEKHYCVMCKQSVLRERKKNG